MTTINKIENLITQHNLRTDARSLYSLIRDMRRTYGGSEADQVERMAEWLDNPPLPDGRWPETIAECRQVIETYDGPRAVLSILRGEATSRRVCQPGGQAITTKYFGPTNFRGSRVKATCDAGSVTLSWDYGLNSDENHRAACEALIEKLGWGSDRYPFRWVGGFTHDGRCVFVRTFA